MNSDTERGSALRLLMVGQVWEDIEVRHGRSRAQVFVGCLPVSRYCPSAQKCIINLILANSDGFYL